MDSNSAKTASPRILVVDDELVNRVVIFDILMPEGFEIVVATSGPEAIEIVRKTAIDLILCDVTMPGMTGLEVCRRLKADEATRYIPFVIVTGLRASADRVRGIEEGADDYLFKPVDRAELLARVRTTLRLGAYRRILAEREKFGTAMAQMSDGLIHLRGDWSVCSVNEAGRQLLDLPDGNLLGKDLLTHVLERFEVDVLGEDLRGGARRQIRFDMSRSTTDRPPLVLSASLTRVAGPAGEPIDLVLCLRNVTEERAHSQAKDRFISLMSHKLRTPITILLGHVDLVSSESAQNLRREQQESMAAIAHAAAEIDGLFERIVSFVELSDHECGVQLTDERLSRVFEQVAALAGRWQSRKPVSIEVVPPIDDRVVRIDPHLMGIVLQNLIENAVKFSQRDSVRMRVEQIPASTEGCAAIAITDDGPGVPPELRDRVFRRFDQIDVGFTGNVEGLGLGLPLARRIMEKHGGSIRLRSSTGTGAASESEVGSGATIVIELPVVASPNSDPNRPAASAPA